MGLLAATSKKLFDIIAQESKNDLPNDCLIFGDKVSIDSRGNISLNKNSDSVQKDFNKNIAMLKKIENTSKK